MKKVLIYILFCASVINAQTAGNAGLSFLKLGFGARAISMGNVGSVNINDVTALNYNPAWFAGMTSPEMAFSHNEWIQDIRSEYLGAGFRLFGIPMAVGVNTTSVSDIELRTQPGEALSKFNANYFSGSLSTGFNITEEFSLGATVKYLYEGMLSDQANGLGFDFGVLYKTPYEGFTLGAALRNLGSMNELRVQETKLPTDFAIGIGYNYDFTGQNAVVNAGAEFQKYTLTDESHVNIGGEVIYDDMAILRAGYQYGYENRGFTTGLGLKWYNLSVDYAFIPYTEDFGISHTITIKFKF